MKIVYGESIKKKKKNYEKLHNNKRLLKIMKKTHIFTLRIVGKNFLPAGGKSCGYGMALKKEFLFMK